MLVSLCARIQGAPHYAELAERCCCLPIALEAAGRFLARKRSKPLDEYLAELETSRLALLSRDLDEPNLAVSSLLGYSVQTLELPQRAALRALCVMPADFSRWFGCKVGACDGDMLDRLVKSSLLSYRPDAQRYLVHDLIRELV